jgi:signal transduction histidine kinase
MALELRQLIIDTANAPIIGIDVDGNVYEWNHLQATQAAKVKTERNMTAYFAHELRNPLGAVDSALSAMPDGLPESAKDLLSGMYMCSS